MYTCARLSFFSYATHTIIKYVDAFSVCTYTKGDDRANNRFVYDEPLISDERYYIIPID